MRKTPKYLSTIALLALLATGVTLGCDRSPEPEIESEPVAKPAPQIKAQPGDEMECGTPGKPSCFELGFKYRQGEVVAKDDARAAMFFEKSCDSGNQRGCYHLGLLYVDGEGVEQDDARAASLFQEACEDGDASSCFNLGLFYQQGRGVAQDDERAASFYKKACNDGISLACIELKSLTENEEGSE